MRNVCFMLVIGWFVGASIAVAQTGPCCPDCPCYAQQSVQYQCGPNGCFPSRSPQWSYRGLPEPVVTEQAWGMQPQSFGYMGEPIGNTYFGSAFPQYPIYYQRPVYYYSYPQFQP